MMDDVYEQAAKRVMGASVVLPDDARLAQEYAGAVWSAQYGCPQCHGTGKISHKPDGYFANHGCNEFCPCPSEHVTMENPHTGEQVHCDPANDEAKRALAALKEGT